MAADEPCGQPKFPSQFQTRDHVSYTSGTEPVLVVYIWGVPTNHNFVGACTVGGGRMKTTSESCSSTNSNGPANFEASESQPWFFLFLLIGAQLLDSAARGMATRGLVRVCEPHIDIVGKETTGKSGLQAPASLGAQGRCRGLSLVRAVRARGPCLPHCPAIATLHRVQTTGTTDHQLLLFMMHNHRQEARLSVKPGVPGTVARRNAGAESHTRVLGTAC